ncbi:MAG: GNAT family N-acetyltransferase [Prevotellaceae bacterium]|jgi:predicted acetyltransferase|nr:GNAT family N-acetyltransferase [Prevotellaceae bacterium]
MKDAVKTLWQICFDDTEQFVDCYFENLYSDTCNEAIVRNAQLIAATQLLSFPLQWSGKELPVAYLSGICTHPDYRRQGVMRALLDTVLNRLYREEVWAAALIPAETWLFDVYGKFGFADVFNYSTELFTASVTTSSTCEVQPYTSRFREETIALLHNCPQRPCGLLITEAYFDVIIKAFAVEKRPVLLCIDKGCPVGVAFASEQQRVLAIAAVDETVRNLLLNDLCRLLDCSCLTVLTPPQEEILPLGMLRIVAAEKWMAHYATAHPRAELSLHLSDPFIAANNGYFHISDGQCRRVGECRKAMMLSMNDLSRLLLADEKPYMMLMLNE